MSIETQPRLWTPSGFREDEWRHAEAFDPAEEPAARLILPLEAWLALSTDVRAEHAERLGVKLAAGEAVGAILPHLSALPLIALVFPSFSDGRSFSKAALLRREGYSGALRAVGDVLFDQIAHMIRTGFTEFEVSNPTALRRLAEGRLGGLPLHYQPAVAAAATGAGFAWRRRPTA